MSKEQLMEQAIQQMHTNMVQRIKANAATIARLAQYAAIDGWVGDTCAETVASIVMMGALV